MKDVVGKLSQSQEISAKVGRVLRRRAKTAQERWGERVRKAYEEHGAALRPQPGNPWEAWQGWYRYSIDFAQRTVLFWDTLRQRGNDFLEREKAGKPPLLHFEYEVVLDARTFERPVNYELLRIVPPNGVEVDPKRRPYVIIDPRAGHGPGIGGFKDDSQVGVALREGHPVYFVVFFPDPEPGQTLLDVCAAEARFIREVRRLHPDSPKPAIVGNCQGGWAAMMLAASNQEDTGPIVINGAPMSYWGGAWKEGEGDNPMRYSGGLLGGTWLASLTADLGDGVFDGAWLVQNFENLNPANTFWDKYYHVFANADTEPPRFLEFERWWGGFYLMNREEIEWIVRNLFVGNKLWSGGVKGEAGKAFDLREIRSPIILFASMGDNITPPQQAFNWVADVYGSTEEIKARGQTIVGLVHQDIGHLGIFVSGKVAKKEHAQIVSVMKSIEALPPGLYAMNIAESRGAGGEKTYEVEFTERRLEDVVSRLNRFQREDEKPFQAVEAISEFNQRAYEFFGRPLAQALSNELGARLGRSLHPLRLQRWAASDLNPWLAWLGPAAEWVKANRQAMSPEEPMRQAERLGSELVSASLDYYRDLRDAASEAAFFLIYGNLFSLHLSGKPELQGREADEVPDPRDLPFVREALDSVAEGGYPEALARVGALVASHGEPMPLSRLEMRKELLEDYRDLLPDLPRDQMRRIRGEQEIVVRYAPDQAVAALPKLLPDQADRDRLLTLVDRLLGDDRIRKLKPRPDELATLARVKQVLSAKAGNAPIRRGSARAAPRSPRTKTREKKP